MAQIDHCDVRFETRKWGHYGQLYAVVALSCGIPGCRGQIKFQSLLMGTLYGIFIGPYGPLEEHPLDYTLGGRYNPQGHCSECGLVYQLTRVTVDKIILQAPVWVENQPVPVMRA